MAVRLQDIAKDLNLSAMTISKVLRGQAGVSSETMARVLRRAQELNYRPNATARSLRTGQTRTIGMVVPQLERAGVPDLITAIRKTLYKENYGLIVAFTGGDEESEERETERQLDRQVDALIFCVRDDAAELPDALNRATTPVVLIGNRPLRSPVFSVSLCEEQTGSVAAMHLLKRRSRRIAYLRGVRNAVEDQRFSGFLAAMRTAHITVDKRWIIELDANESEFIASRDAVAKVLSGTSRPDGMICCSDASAAGALTAARSVGISVPEQLQIIGIGNAAEICEAFSLTAVDLSGVQLGRSATRMVLRLVQQKGKAFVKNISLSPTVITRASTRA